MNASRPAPLTHLEIPGAITAGGLLYLLTRPSGLLMFTWVERLGAAHALGSARGRVRPLASALPEWVRYSLPDALWAFAFVSAMCAIWRHRLSAASAGWIGFAVLCAGGSELGQALGVVRGTFDWHDLLLLAVACALALRRVVSDTLSNEISNPIEELR